MHSEPNKNTIEKRAHAYVRTRNEIDWKLSCAAHQNLTRITNTEIDYVNQMQTSFLMTSFFFSSRLEFSLLEQKKNHNFFLYSSCMTINDAFFVQMFFWCVLFAWCYSCSLKLQLIEVCLSIQSSLLPASLSIIAWITHM